jgi:hypothetical protein
MTLSLHVALDLSVEKVILPETLATEESRDMTGTQYRE